MRFTGIIILVAFAIAAYVIGHNIFITIKENIALKEDIERVEKKVDSLFLDNQKIFHRLAAERDSIFQSMRIPVNEMKDIVDEVNSYKPPKTREEIRKELERLSQ